MVCEVLVALALLGGASAGRPRERALPDTWGALQAELPTERARRVTALLRFSNDDVPAVSERVRASRAARALLAADDRRVVDAHQLEGELAGALGQAGARRTALRAARAAARKLAMAERAQRLDEVMRGDDALKLLARAVPGALARKRAVEPRLVEEAKRALAAFLAIGDERTHGLARMWIALGDWSAASTAATSTAAEDQAARLEATLGELADAVDALGTARLHAGARAEVLLARARLLQDSGRVGEAARDRVAVDRERDVDLKRSGLVPSSRAPWLRSKETAALCKLVRQEKTACAREEEQRYGSRTYYDFSQEKASSFDTLRADDVLAEYESVLHGCLKQGAKDNLTTDTHVELEWAVGNDGRVKSVDVRPTRLRGTSVDTCMQQAFALFRYPRYGGEMQHVRLDFNVGG